MKKLQIRDLPEQPYEVTEAINQLRVNLGFCGKEIQTIALTSSLPNEGKTFLALHLWKAMAEVGMTAVLVDCDLRKSEIGSRYLTAGKEKIYGTAHFLSGNAGINDVLYETNITGGYLIPAGKTVTNPTLLLESSRLSWLIEELSKTFDYVLIDTPPIGSVADAMTLASLADGTVLVVESEYTSRRLVGNSIQLLKRTGTPLLGMVLNRVNLSSRSRYYYSYKSYYRKYYRSGSSRYGGEDGGTQDSAPEKGEKGGAQ